MKKYAVMVMAVMLTGVMASGAYARVELDFSSYKEIFYVGEEVSIKVTATIIRNVEVVSPTYSFEIRRGELPPDCELKQYGSNNGTAYITGKLTEAGNYDFTVWVTVNGLLRGTYGYTRTFEDAGYINGKMYIITPENPTVSDDIGGNTSKDVPVPTPDQSRDIPAPNPAPKPEAINVIAEKLGLTSDEVSYIASSDMTAKQNPTASITNAVDAEGYEIVSTQESINVEKSGTYAFRLTVPADLVGTETGIKAYLADRSIFNSTSVSSSALPTGVVEAEIFTTSGDSVTVLPEVILAAANLQADTATTFSTHIAKASSSSDNNTNTGDNTNNNTGNNTGGNTGNNTGGDTGNNNTQTDNDNDTPEAVSGSGGGGGCNSGLAILALALSALITLRKSRS